jgi:type IVB pilus formation R64 PilN family outer membrane protein
VSEKGKASAISTVISSLGQIIAAVPGSAVVRSDGSGRIAVTTTKEAMTKVREFLRSENEAMLRQAQVQFDIYSIRRDESDERGIEWGLVVESISKALKMGLTSPATLTGPSVGSINFAILDSNTSSNRLARALGDSTALLKLLSQYGTSTQHRPVSLLTLNRQWARKASLGSKAYVSETVPGSASTLGAGAPGLKTATVTTGDRYLAQPYIMDNNTVVLKFGVGLSSLVQIANVTSGSGSTQQTVQTPEISNLIDQSTVALKAGQVLVITGLSRIVTFDDTRKLTEDASLLAGGSRKLMRQREDFVIFVRPTIL